MSACKPEVFEGKRFTECLAVPGKNTITTKLKSSNGMIYRGFDALARDIGDKDVAFAMNGGMFDILGHPIGYFAEDGRSLHAINRKDGQGNFYLKPNGIFFGDPGGNWRILKADDFAKLGANQPEFATQSGPMLLLNGQLSPAISPNGSSLYIRNAIGVDAEGRAHFVISDEPVSFGLLARMMRDHAKTADALYLDGAVSALWNPAIDRMDGRYPLGPLILVTTIRKGTHP